MCCILLVKWDKYVKIRMSTWTSNSLDIFAICFFFIFMFTWHWYKLYQVDDFCSIKHSQYWWSHKPRFNWFSNHFTFSKFGFSLFQNNNFQRLDIFVLVCWRGKVQIAFQLWNLMIQLFDWVSTTDEPMLMGIWDFLYLFEFLSSFL